MHGVIYQGKLASEATTFGLVWPVVPPIQQDIARFFVHQFLWKESFDASFFCIDLVISGRQYLRLPLLVG